MKPEGKDSLPSQFGRYTLVDRLATGGMAEVFKAKILSTHGFEKLLVIKRILPHLAADKTFVSMFIDEAKLTAQLTHPKIVQVTDFGDVKGQYFIALEFVDGFDALALLRTSAQKQLRLPIPISMFITMEVLDALDYAHNAKDSEGKAMRLVHRDISPSNVFISRRGDVKLGDFGIAHAQERESKTQAGTLKGKYGYMSPEQVLGASLDARSDLFAVGIVLAEMLMGKRLFTAPNDLDVLLMVRDGRLDRLDKYCRDIPPELDQIVRKALQKRVGDRYQSAGEFRDALGDFLFKAGFRVGPSDVGRLASDFFDSGAEASARVAALCRKWEVKTPGNGKMPVSAKGDLPTGPSTSAIATNASTPPPMTAPHIGDTEAGVPTSARTGTAAPRTVPSASDDTIEVVIDDEPGTDTHAPAGAPTQATRGSPARNKQGKIASALDDVLSQTLAIVDLDEYNVPGLGQQGIAGTPLPAQPAVIAVDAGGLAQPGRVPDSAGDLSVVSPMRVLVDLAVAQETGLLRVEFDPHVKEIFLVRGAPESVNSNLPSDRFGEYALAHGFIKPADLETALGALPRFSGKMGDTLVGLGLMRPLDVFRLLSQQVRERVMEVFGWESGYFTFYRNVRNPLEAFPLGLDPFEILGAGVLTLSYDFLELRFTPLLDYRPRALARPRISVDAFRLGPTPRDLCALLDGRQTLRDWIARFSSPSELLTFLRTLYLLAQADLVQFA